MRKILLLTALLFISGVLVAQPKLTAADTARWEFLKVKLKTASGIREVDLLNELSWEYMWLIANENIKTDTISLLKYISLAQTKARKLKYERGLGLSYLIQSKIYKRTNKAFADSLRSLSKEIAIKINDQQLLGRLAMDAGNVKEANEFYKKSGDLDGEFETAFNLCLRYSGGNSDFNEQEFSYCQRAFELADKKRQRNISYFRRLSIYTYSTLAGMYKKVGDYQSALNIYKNYSQKYAALLGVDNNWDYGATYSSMGKYDSAVFYFENALRKSPNNHFLMRQVGYVNLKAGKYPRAIEVLKQAYPIYEKSEAIKGGGLLNWRGEFHAHMAEAYDSLGEKKEALRNYKLALENTLNFYNTIKEPSQKGQPFYGFDADRRNWKMSVSEGLAKIFNALGQHDSAYYYLIIHNQLKDSLEDKNRMLQLNMQLSKFKKAAEDQKRTSQIQLLQKDNLLKEQQLQQQILLQQKIDVQLALLNKNNEIKEKEILLKDQKLQIKDQEFKEQQFVKERQRTQLMLLDKDVKLKHAQLKKQTILNNALLAGLFLLITLGVFIVTWLSLKRKNEKLKNEKRQAELQQQSAELEMQALRAQMNPHFIFNCLSSINKFILKNESRTASDYLTRFSRLIRRVLTNSQLSMIPLSDEVEMLRLYLDMERLRFSNSFDYNIIYANTIEPELIYIPPMLLQPFCENAIWHGLMHKEGHGKLDIVMRLQNEQLKCTITDNGIGRAKAAKLKSKSGEKQKSFGLKITIERLALFNGEKSVQTFFKNEDVIDSYGNITGTEVTLHIKYKDDINEPVSLSK